MVLTWKRRKSVRVSQFVVDIVAQIRPIGWEGKTRTIFNLMKNCLWQKMFPMSKKMWTEY